MISELLQRSGGADTATGADNLVEMAVNFSLSYLSPLFEPDIDFAQHIRAPTPGDVWVERHFEERLRPFIFPLEPLRYDPPPIPKDDGVCSAELGQAEEEFWDALWRAGESRPTPFSRQSNTAVSMYPMVLEKDTNTIDRARRLRIEGNPVAAAFEYCAQVPETANHWLEALDTMWEGAQTCAPGLFRIHDHPEYQASFVAVQNELPALRFLGCFWSWNGQNGVNRMDRIADRMTAIGTAIPSTFDDMFAGICGYHYLMLGGAFRPLFWGRDLDQGSYRDAQKLAQKGLSALCRTFPSMEQRLSPDQYSFLLRRLVWAVQECFPYLSIPPLDVRLGGLMLNLPLSAVDLMAASEEELAAYHQVCLTLDTPVAKAGEHLCLIISIARQFSLTDDDTIRIFQLATEYVDMLGAQRLTAALRDLVSALLMSDAPFLKGHSTALRRSAWRLGSDFGSLRQVLMVHPRGLQVAYRLFESASSAIPPPALAQGSLAAPAPGTPSVEFEAVAPSEPLQYLRLGPDLPFEPKAEMDAYLMRNIIINFCSIRHNGDPEVPLHRLLYTASHVLSWEQHLWRVDRAISMWCRDREVANRPSFRRLHLDDESMKMTRNLLAFDVRLLPRDPAKYASLLTIASERLSAMATEVKAMERNIVPGKRASKASHMGIVHLRGLLHYLWGDTILELARIHRGAVSNLAPIASRAYRIAMQIPSTRWSRSGLLAERAKVRLIQLDVLMSRADASILATCLEQEGNVRALWAENLARELYARTASPDQLAAEIRRHQKTSAEVIQSIYQIAHSVCLQGGRDTEAFWWQQRAKAALNWISMAHQKTASLLAMHLRDPDMARTRGVLAWLGAEIDASWWNPAKQFLDKTTLSLTNSVIVREFERTKNTKDLLSRSSRPAEANGKGLSGNYVFVDWWEDRQEDRFTISVARAGGAVEHTELTGITPSMLRQWLRRYWTGQGGLLMESEWVSVLRDLDALIQPLELLTEPDECLVFCPSGALYQLPLHALWISQDQPIVSRNPVTYTMNLAIYLGCLARSKRVNVDINAGPERFLSIASNYRPLPDHPPVAQFDEFKQRLFDRLQKLAIAGHGSLAWDGAVTKECMSQLFSESRIVVFFGHEDLPEQPSGSHLLLADGTFSAGDLMSLDIPGSLLIFMTSGSGTASSGEPPGLTLAALAGGASTVIGKLWPVRTFAAVLFVERLFNWLAHVSTKESDGTINVAKAMHNAISDVRQRYPAPTDWAGFVLHGSPKMVDYRDRAAKAAVRETSPEASSPSSQHDRPIHEVEETKGLVMDAATDWTEMAEEADPLSDGEDGPSFEGLEWSEQSIQDSWKPREIFATPVTQTSEEKAHWDRQFDDDVWYGSSEEQNELPVDAGSSSPSRNTQPSQTPSTPADHNRGKDRALQEFTFTGDLSSTDPDLDASQPRLVFDRQMANGLRITCEVTRIQSGSYNGGAAIFVGFIVRYLNTDDAHTVKRSVINVRVWNLPPHLAGNALAEATRPALAVPGVPPSAVRPTHLSPINTASSQGDPTVGMPGAYPTASRASTVTPTISPSASSTNVASVTTSAPPTAPPPPRGRVPFFIDHRPEHIVGPAQSDLETIQNSLGGQIGTPENTALSVMLNFARQVSRQHTLQVHSEVRVELHPHRPRPFGPRPGPELHNIRNLLNARARTNPYHQSGFKEIRVGTVVMTNARPFVMTVEVECDCKNSLHFHDWPYKNASPLQIGHGRTLHPPNEQPIGVVDFSCDDMDWDSLVPLLEGFVPVPRGTTQ